MAKRSPILGYNHNVKYRGIVFHVQTEDSGLGSPHLFTHLFNEGVIISTRKLVYDPGANEEAIKALMQAQHKAVMKDLMKGTFDDKIDQYLAGVAGLEPSPHGGASKAPPSGRGERAPTEQAPPPEAVLDAPTESVPIETLPPSEESVPIELTVPKPRTTTAQKSSPKPRTQPPPPEDNAQTVTDPTGSIAAAVAAANRSPRPGTPLPRASTPIPSAVPELEEELERELSESARHRLPRDTAVEMPHEVTITPRTRTSGEAAASLPPVKPAARPAMASPTVVSRPVTNNDGRVHKSSETGESEPVEVYSPAPPSAEPPPGERAGRSGTYSMGRSRPPSDNVPLREKTGRIAAINPSMIPNRADRTQPVASPPPSTRAPTPGPGKPADRPSRPMESARPFGKPETPPAGVPQRVSPQVTAPIANRQTPASGNVVMTRPAVIVGAQPAKPAQPPQPPRVRKAREEEGRGFGQGLISEKSLDEVILAYLSEDAEDK